MKKKKEGEKKKKEKKQPQNRELAVIMYLFTGLFIALIGYFVYFNSVLAPDVINNSYNSRQELLAEKTIRGSITASDGTVLAETKIQADGVENRVYPFGEIFAHVVGYASHGKSGIESLGNFLLLTSNASLPEQVMNEIQDEKSRGDTLVTTLDMNLQRLAFASLGEHKGAVIAIEPSTGKILCMASTPSYDPNEISEQWEKWNTLKPSESVLYNRATQGLYAPGSVFKIVTLLSYFREHTDAETGEILIGDEFVFDCSGQYTVGDYTMHCYHGNAHGVQSLKTAFANSCNGAFAMIGQELDVSRFAETCNNLLFGKDLPIRLPSSKSSFSVTEDSGIAELLMTGVGQGKTLVSPLHMALLASCIANDGVLMKPMLIDRIEDYNGGLVRNYYSSSYGTFMTPTEADLLTEYMEQVVAEGTASKLGDLPVKVAGKTGSAEFGNDKSKTHAWFVGFSVEEEQDLAVCVLVEEAGSGSEYAVPIARRLFEAYYQQR